MLDDRNGGYDVERRVGKVRRVVVGDTVADSVGVRHLADIGVEVDAVKIVVTQPVQDAKDFRLIRPQIEDRRATREMVLDQRHAFQHVPTLFDVAYGDRAMTVVMDPVGQAETTGLKDPSRLGDLVPVL